MDERVMTEFKAIAEDNGEKIIVVEIQHWSRTPTLGDPTGVTAGMKSLVRSDTRGHLNLLKDGRLQEVISGRIFQRA